MKFPSATAQAGVEPISIISENTGSVLGYVKACSGALFMFKVYSFFSLQFAKIIHFLYISLVVDFTWLFYTKTMIRIKITKSNITEREWI